MSSLVSMSGRNIAIANAVEKKVLTLEQTLNTTMHSIHDGVYTRSMKLSQGEMLVSANIKIPTTLIIQGNIELTIGDDIVKINGFDVVVADGNRKQLMYANEDTFLTMIFKTNARTIEEAEMQFTDDYDKLMSRQDSSINIIRRGI